jgi:hypothetical protein
MRIPIAVKVREIVFVLGTNELDFGKERLGG